LTGSGPGKIFTTRVKGILTAIFSGLSYRYSESKLIPEPHPWPILNNSPIFEKIRIPK
jgi:hypothetical protein